MLHAGLDLSRRRVDVCLLSDRGELVAETAAPADVFGLRGLVERVAGQRQPVRAVIESMNGARFVHDSLEERGWEVLVADAHRVKGLAPLACKTDKIDARVLAVLSQRDLVPAIWLPDPSIRRERELARFRRHLVRHRMVCEAVREAAREPSLGVAEARKRVLSLRWSASWRAGPRLHPPSERQRLVFRAGGAHRAGWTWW